MAMVKALCCHTFARQNLFSPAARPTAITAAGTWAVVASEEQWVRVYDLEQAPGTLTAAFPSHGRVKALALCREENFIVALESGPRPSGELGRSNRCVRVYRNFWSQTEETARQQELPQPRNANQPPSQPGQSQRFEVLQFSSLHSPTGLYLAADSQPARLMAAVGHSVWVVSYNRERLHFDLLFTITFSFPVSRLALHRDVLAAGSMDEVHVVRLCDQPPRSRFHDEVILPTMARERRDVKPGGRAMEVLGPTVDVDIAPAKFSATAQPKRPSFIETLLYRRFPSASNIRVHTVQLFSNPDISIFIATTFEGFLYRVSDVVKKSAEYAFSERTLQARVGSDYLLHVITTCGLNTYTTRSGDLLCCYAVPEEFPICMIGSLVWREINMRCLLAWSSGLLLYTEKDNLYTLYSLQFQPIDHLFMDMLQAARQFVADSVLTSCHLVCEAFHLHSLLDVRIDRDKAVALLEFHMNALPNLHVEHLRQLFVVGGFGLEDVIYICEKLKEKEVDTRCFLRLYAAAEEKFVANVQRASDDVMRRFYPLLMESDHDEYIRCILLRNDRNWYTSREDLLSDVSLESPEAILLTCLFLFETSRVDEIESFIHKGNEEAMRHVLTRFPHVLREPDTGLLSDFAMFLCLIAPRMLNAAVMSLDDRLPSNLPQCCVLLIQEARFSQDRTPDRLLPVVDSLLTLLTAGQPPTFNSPRQARPGVCPHKSLRCRHVEEWLLSQRMSVLDCLPPFSGVNPEDFGAHRSSSSSCCCVVCHAHLLRLQGLLCWAVAGDNDAVFSLLSERTGELSGYVRPSALFLLAHRTSVPAAFAVLRDNTSLQPAIAYLRRYAARVNGAESWRRLVNACEHDSERQWAVLKAAISLNPPHVAAEMVTGLDMKGREKEVQALLSSCYTSAMSDQLFTFLIDQLATG